MAEVEITSAWDDAPIGRVTMEPANEVEVEHAIAASVTAFATMKRLAAFERAAILAKTSALIEARREDFARLIAREVGKPIRDARAEAGRAATTFQVAAEEAKRLTGEAIPLDIAERGRGRLGITRLVPRGPIAAITPFNFPLNLVAHKVAPALACGCPVVLKPAPQAPLTALALRRALADAGLPAGAFAVLPGGPEVGARIVEDERLRLVSFTGSDKVGWEIKRRAGKKPAILELGGNAAVIVCADADLEAAAKACASGGFAYAGQVCISVQRIIVDERIAAPFLDLLVAKVRALVVGDPLDEKTDLGPLIHDAACARVEAWVGEALARGARALIGGRRSASHRRVYEPTVLVDAPADSAVVCKEAFGPLVVVSRFKEFDEAIAAANAGTYGLQAGLFTQDVTRILRAFEALEVGGLIVNDAPTFRVDHMPYGGTRDSGLGREGLKYAIEAMTEPRLLVLPGAG